MGKHKYAKVKGFLNFLYEAEIHAVPKTWQKWISIVRKKYGKTQTFQICGFLKEELHSNYMFLYFTLICLE